MANDEMEIRRLIEALAAAVRSEDRDAIRALHDPGILMFDVPPPFLSRGIEAYMATWELFLSTAVPPVRFHFRDIEVAAGGDVAFAAAIGQCVTMGAYEGRAPLDFRVTFGLRKGPKGWRIVHEHHSVPAE